MNRTGFTVAILAVTLGCSGRTDRTEPAPAGPVTQVPAYRVGAGTAMALPLVRNGRMNYLTMSRGRPVEARRIVSSTRQR